MKTIGLTLIFLSAVAVADERNSVVYQNLTFRTGGMDYRLYVTEGDFDGSPVWKPGNEEPPLLPNDAHKRAIEELKKLRPADWQLYSTVSINMTRKNEDPLGRFYYWIHFYRLPETDKLSPIPVTPDEERMLFFYVLLNGKVLGPKPTKLLP